MSEHRRLVVLDDDELFTVFVRRAADSIGLPCGAFTEPDSFLESVRQQPPTDIILDLQLGAADGVEVLRALAAMSCRARILLLSGFDGKVLSSARELGVTLGLDVRDALAKPIRTPELLEALRFDLPMRPPVPDALDFARGVREGELLLEYQPVVDCIAGRTQGVEALCRWQRADGSRVGPAAFIPLAEADPELMDLLTMKVAELAAHGWRTLSAAGLKTPVALNISAVSLQRLDFPERLAAKVGLCGVAPREFKLEITETAAMADPQATLDILLRLRLKGFLLAVDDFGVGFTTMAMLRRMPFAELKVDRSVVLAMAESEDGRAVVRGVAALGRSIGMRTVGEGVETPEMLKALRDAGIDSAQGYLISPPLSLDGLLPWMEHAKKAEPSRRSEVRR